ncbi:fimbrial protein [Brenneria sp. 4F2]|nr:fimbrial protein [Brenneria bubanii]
MYRAFFIFLPLAWLTLSPAPSRAGSCTANSTSHSVSLAQLPRDVPVGTVLATGSITTSVTCTADTAQALSWLAIPSSANQDYGASSIANVRKTAYPGIGVYWENIASGTGTVKIISAIALNDSGTTNQRGMQVGSSSMVDTFKLVKISDIASGAWPPLSLGWSYRNQPNTQTGALFAINLLSAPVSVSACSVNNQAVNVSFSTIKGQIDLKGPGTTTAAQPFNLSLNCTAATPINVTFGGIRNAIDNALGILALDDDSGATGIGVQLLRNNQPLIIGNAISLGKTNSDGNIDFPFSARVYQSGERVTAGAFRATATFTLTYQ